MTSTSRITSSLWQRWTGASPAPKRSTSSPRRAALDRSQAADTDFQASTLRLGLDEEPRMELAGPTSDERHVGDEGRPLLRALSMGQFELYYQAQFDCVSRQLIGVEALLRWQHPVHGLRLPGEFIGAAERSGAILQLDAWALRTACHQMRQWLDLDIAPPLMAVNVSAAQFARPDLVDFVAEVLRETGLAADRLELEIVERALLDPVRAAPTMRRLRAMGVRLAIDDFGTGYSSLGYLSRYPVNRLKIDRCFVARMGRDRTSVAITDAVVALGLSLGLDVVAEGVETEDQLEHLRLHLCPAAQGWLFGQPQPAANFAQLLRRERPGRGGIKQA
ncbi:putative bifunctional diguanylate cyclase/phosphodiesterase [Sphaerotilus mobilis]|uniref:EAL domain-containing protein (Putative c-di-GMP-specific phosphodiesterase class I) n=1 Tax=Sphaerotilus mobilis TaxID=47994 RepID=A0A4Q7LU30_9BURK|nr:EAL domain-containing protein [Sphaerotilus mobilis]RZS58284.1 EAL domain-containing protein (putative c-di-GMP-specific phosphodiesterase class I) [Sphaerotilus mobilis]